MAVDNPWAIDGLELPALAWRRAMSGLLMHDTDPVSARPGVLSGCAVTVASLTATVGAGQLVLTPHVGSNGSYIFGLTATALTVSAQDATYARIDRVVARIYDNAVDGSGQSRSAVEIVTGTPSATPAAPSLPSGALELAQLQVPKSGGGSIVVVDRRLFAVAAGGTLYAPDLAALQAITPPRPGIKAVIGSGAAMAEYTYTGSAWRLVAEDTGWVTAGLTLTPGTNWTVTSYRLRRINGRVTGMVILTYSGSTAITASSSSGSVAEQAIVTLPAGWAPAGYQMVPDLARLRRADAGGSSQIWWARGFPNGIYNLTAGVPGASLASGGILWLYVDHPVD